MKTFVKANQLQDQFEIHIDEGLQKAGQYRSVPFLKGVMKENVMLFHSSATNLLIQVADFFAFTMNRNQLIAIKEPRTPFDIVLLTLLNTVFMGNPSSGSEAVMYESGNYSKSDYDAYQISKFKEFGVYDYWKKVTRKP